MMIKLADALFHGNLTFDRRLEIAVVGSLLLPPPTLGGSGHGIMIA